MKKTTQIGELFDVDERAEREARFKAHAVEWLKTRFGDVVIHAHADHDETTCHIHAVIMPRHEKSSGRRGLQRILQPSAYPLLRSYEAAQDDVGSFFEEIGLKRGAKGAAARRAVLELNKAAREVAKETGEEPILQGVPILPERVPTPVWYAREVQRLKEKAEELVESKAAISEKHKRAELAEAEAQATNNSAKSREDTAVVREHAVLEREKDADDIVAIAAAVSGGQFDFEGGGDDVKPIMRPPESKEEERIQERLKNPSQKARDFFQSLPKTYGFLRSKADKKAAENLASEVASVQAVSKAIETFKTTMLKFVPKQVRNRLLRDILSVERGERKMDESVGKSKTNKRGDEIYNKNNKLKNSWEYFFYFLKRPILLLRLIFKAKVYLCLRSRKQTVTT